VERNKRNGTYRCGDVKDRLITDFHNKCYLCEESDVSSIDIEHFIPHQNQDLALKFDWNNLFLACSHCNSLKGLRLNLLNCTNPNHQITERIEFYIEPLPFSQAKIIAVFDDELTKNTVSLLDHIYNYPDSTNNAYNEALNIRKKLILEILSFQSLLVQYFYGKGLNQDDKLELSQQIRRKLHPESAFTAFKIWIIKSKQTFMNEFSQYLPQ
jgi:hypothetical protein